MVPAAGVILMMLVACDHGSHTGSMSHAASPGQPDHAALGGWLECIECANGEFDSVLVHGPALQDTLIELLHTGAPAERRQVLRVRLAGPYAQLSTATTASTGGAVLPDSATYTNLYLTLLSNRYQARSAAALAEMGGTVGRDALEQAVADSLNYPELLRPAIRLARDTARVRFR